MANGSDIVLDVFSDYFFMPNSKMTPFYINTLSMCVESVQSVLWAQGVEIDRNDLAHSFKSGPNYQKMMAIAGQADNMAELLTMTPDLMHLVLHESERQKANIVAELESIIGSIPALEGAAPIVDSLVSGPEECEVIPGKPVRAYESIKEEDGQTYNLHRSTGLFVGTNSVNKRKLQILDD